MGGRNYLVEGVSGTGKTAVCEELSRCGYRAIHGDRELAYQGDPETGAPVSGRCHEHHIWDVAKVRALVADTRDPVTFFCGGSRNVRTFIDLFDEVFVLEIDRGTLERRIDERVRRDPTEWGAQPEERDLILRLHRTQGGVPEGRVVDATGPLEQVVDEILRQCGLGSPPHDL